MGHIQTVRHDMLRWFGDRLLQLTSALSLVLVASACATNPVTGSRDFVFMSETREIELGRQADAEITRELGVHADLQLQTYVEEIGFELAAVSHRPELPWQFRVVDSPVVNAFAVPGGFIYLTRGLMAYLSDESELTGVIGHEIGHVTARHSVQAYSRAAGAQVGLVLSQIFVPVMRSPYYGVPGLGDAAGQGLGLLLLKFGRDDEKQADRLGAEYAVQSGWDPNGVSDMLTTLGRIADTTDRRGTPNWLSTHPEPEDRVADVAGTVKALIANATDPSKLRVNRSGYLERIDGLVYGDNPEQGIMRGSDFLHAALRFALVFPDGWVVQNSAELVIAREPGRNNYMVLQLATDTGLSLQRIAETEMTSVGFMQKQGTSTQINGLDAYLGTYSQDVDEQGTIIARVAHIRFRESVYMFGGFAPVENFPLIERDVSDSLQSFRQLTRDEADQIRPNRISIYTVREGETWQEIAQHVGDESVQASTLAIMNGYPVDEQPHPGDRIKIVVPG